MENQKLFCPKCGKLDAEKGRGAFTQVGWDKETESADGEWDGHEYTCNTCGTQFMY